MKFTTRLLTLTASLILLAPLAARAQFTAPPPPRPFPGFVNERMRAADPYATVWDIGASFRARMESKFGAGFTDAGSNWDFSRRPVDDNHNTYLLTRFMPRVAYAGKWLAATVEARFSDSFGDERFNATAGNGLTERDGGGDFHQAFVMLGNHKEFPVSLKVGRQELAYGDQRLVGHFRWNNNARTFDAVKVRWQNPVFGVDLFTGGVVYNDHLSVNRMNPQDVFSGAYFNFPSFPVLSSRNLVEGYLFARNVQRGIATDDWSGIPAPFRFPGAQDLYTAGLRLKSKPGAVGPWDYGVELMHQFGNRTAVFPATTAAAALAAPRLDHQAYAVVAQSGYTWTESGWQPRLAFLYSFGSGDRNATDLKSGTFQNLFPTNHLFYGYMDLSSLQNLHDLRLAFTFKPTPTVSIALEGHVHRLARTTDFWYNIAGVPRNVTTAAVGSGGSYRINPSYSKSVGRELDLVAAWSFRHYGQLEIGASRYFRGQYIKQSLSAVGSKDASYFYTQLTLNL